MLGSKLKLINDVNYNYSIFEIERSTCVNAKLLTRIEKFVLVPSRLTIYVALLRARSAIVTGT